MKMATKSPPTHKYEEVPNSNAHHAHVSSSFITKKRGLALVGGSITILLIGLFCTTFYLPAHQTQMGQGLGDEREKPNSDSESDSVAVAITIDHAEEMEVEEAAESEIEEEVFLDIAATETTTTNATESKSNLPQPTPQEVRSCELEECMKAGCSKTLDPFVCLIHNGGPHGGCRDAPWLEGTCDIQCDLTICDTLVIPDSADSCEGRVCSDEWCEEKKGQRCGYTAPYQCMNGSAGLGCTSDELGWTFKTSDVVCSQCCDTRTC